MCTNICLSGWDFALSEGWSQTGHDALRYYGYLHDERWGRCQNLPQTAGMGIDVLLPRSAASGRRPRGSLGPKHGWQGGVTLRSSTPYVDPVRRLLSSQATAPARPVSRSSVPKCFFLAAGERPFHCRETGT